MSRISTALNPTLPLALGLVLVVNVSSSTDRMMTPCGRVVELPMMKTINTSHPSMCCAQDDAAADAPDAAQET
jgi:hypothetical protein